MRGHYATERCGGDFTVGLYNCKVPGGVVERGGSDDVRSCQRGFVVPTPEGLGQDHHGLASCELEPRLVWWRP